MKLLTTKFFYKVHFGLGAVLSLFFLILSLTGSILLLKPEKENQPPQEVSSNKLFSYEALLRQSLARYSSHRPLSLTPDESQPTLFQLRLSQPTLHSFRNSKKIILNRISGKEELARSDSEKNSFLRWVLHLHRELLLGSSGKIVVGCVGLCFLLVLFSGGVIYWKFTRHRRFGEIRRSSVTATLSDFHKWVGISILGWALLIGLTGCFLAFNSTLIKIFQFRELSYLKKKYVSPAQDPLFSPSSQASLDEVISNALQVKPGYVLSYLAFPDTEYSIPNHYLALVHPADQMKEKSTEIVVVRSENAEVVESLEMPLYLKMVTLSEPIHFGRFGGPVVKYLWFAFSFGLTFLILTGVGTSVLRRVARKRFITAAAFNKG